ncbi:MAG: TolB family protein [Actinoallomurus sp.]
MFVVAGLFVGQASAASRGRNGQISFVNNSSGSPQIARINPDGSHRVQLTHTSTKHWSLFSDWSPNGREIVFDSDRTGAWQVYTMRADGTDIHKLTHMRGFSGQASWSPDGSRIVFAHSSTGNPPFDLYTVGAEGGPVHRLTHSAQFEELPVYSPDGRWIAFSTFPDTGAPALHLMRADGSHVHRLTPPRLRASGPEWSPDGRRIVALANSDRKFSMVFTIRPDGTGIRLITPKQQAAWPSYSPDGRQIVFARLLTGQANSDLWVMNADGSNEHAITHTPNVVESIPDWGTHHLTH